MSASNRRRSALDRPLPLRGKNEVGLSAFAFMFSEFIQYSQQRVNTAEELERKLEDAGVGIGRRVLELGCLREKSSKRETRMIGILNFIQTVVWKMLFGNAADSLEKSVDQEDEFMIVEKNMIVNAFISAAPCSCAAFVAGIVRGVLEGAQVRARDERHVEPRSVLIPHLTHRLPDCAVSCPSDRARARGLPHRHPHQVRARGFGSREAPRLVSAQHVVVGSSLLRCV